MLLFLLDQNQDLPAFQLNFPLANSTILEPPTTSTSTADTPTDDSDSDPDSIDHIDDTVHLLKGKYSGQQLAYKGYIPLHIRQDCPFNTD